MGEQAELIINGDVCEGCGENFEDEGQGYPRRCSSCKGMPKVAINTIKADRISKSRNLLKSNGLKWKEFNNGYYWRINDIDFWPTKDKWMSPLNGEIQHGLIELINFINFNKKELNKLSVDQLFEIACHSKEKSLIGICRALHKEIYG